MKLNETKKAKILEMLGEFTRTAKSGNQETFARMSKCERYRIGRQWDPKVLEFNRQRKKFSLTINRIHPLVNQLSGFEARNPMDIKSIPLKGGTAKGAQIHTCLIRSVLDKSHATKQQNQAFEDGISTGRGILVFDIDYQNDPESGDLTIRKNDPFMFLPDPACKSYDYNDAKNGAKFLILEEWVDKDAIACRYPDAADDLAASKDVGGFFAWANRQFSRLTSFLHGTDARGGTETTYRDQPLDGESGMIEFERYKYRVTTTYWKEWRKGAFLYRKNQDGMVLTSAEEIEAARRILTLEPGSGNLVETDKNGNPIAVAVLHKSVSIGDVLLDYKEDPFGGMMLYPIVRFAPYYINGYEFGVVENLLDVQDQVNWSWSMELNLIKLLANAGWRIAKDLTGKMSDWLATHGTQDGVVLDKSKFGGEVDKLDPTPIPASYDLITQRGSQYMTEISQVRLEEPQAAGKESGKAIQLKQNATVTNTSNIQSNWEWTLRLAGEVMIGMIQSAGVFTDEEIESIVEEEDLLDPKMLAQARQIVLSTLERKGIRRMDPPAAPMRTELFGMDPAGQQEMLAAYKDQVSEFQRYVQTVDAMSRPIAKAMLIDQIRSLRFGKYGSQVTVSPHSETERIRRMAEMFALNESLLDTGQPGVSRRQLIESTDLPNKDEIIRDVPQAAPSMKGAA